MTLPRSGVGQVQGGRRHGLSVAEIESLRARQRGLCPICQRELPPVPLVDHDHGLARSHPHPVSRGCHYCVRSLLCNPCNLMIGNAQDDPERLRAGATYLELWRDHR